jgi:hypothetical protein
MFRAKALIFMIPLVLPIGQPPADATDQAGPTVIDCEPPADLDDGLALDRPDPFEIR